MNEYEKYSLQYIQEENDNWFQNNSDIRWHANCVERFEDDEINEMYVKDSYAKQTRWDLWNSAVDVFLHYGIKTNIDIGCANNQFSFLCNKKEILSLGIDPRKFCVSVSENVFHKYFDDVQYGYVGTLKTFIDFFQNKKNKLQVDCISVLNFLHGNDHDPLEIKQFFELLPKVTKYILISEPKWESLGLSKMTDNYNILSTINNGSLHILYQLNI